MIAAAVEADLSDLLEVRVSDNSLVVVYDYDTDKEAVEVPCKCYIYMYEGVSTLRICIDDVEIKFEL